jgi:hypothetical protein
MNDQNFNKEKSQKLPIDQYLMKFDKNISLSFNKTEFVHHRKSLYFSLEFIDCLSNYFILGAMTLI